MKLLIFSDIHSDLKTLGRLMDTEADYYVCAGDLVSWARGLDKAGEVMKRRAGRVYVLPGNHESARQVSSFCEQFGFESLHGRHVVLDGIPIAGLGYSSPTPFNTPGEYSEDQMAEQLAKLADCRPRVLICHSPPKGTSLDRAAPGLHFGSRAMREFIDRMQPDFFFCGHIHEAEGAEEQFGRTFAVNVGKRGYLLDLDKLKKSA